MEWPFEDPIGCVLGSAVLDDTAASSGRVVAREDLGVLEIELSRFRSGERML